MMMRRKEILLGMAGLLIAANGFGARIHESWTGDAVPQQWRLSQPKALTSSDDRLFLTGNAGQNITGWMQFIPALPQDYAFQLDFRPAADHWKGYGFTVDAKADSMERPVWYIEFIGNRIGAYGVVDGQWRHFGGSEPMADPFGKTLRLTVRNAGNVVDIKVEQLPGTNNAKDAVPVVFQAKFRHDVAPGESFLKLNCSNAEDMSVELQEWTFGGELSGDSGRFPTAPAQFAGRIASSEIVADVAADGNIFLSRPDAKVPFAVLSVAMESVPAFESLPLKLTSNTVADGRIEQRWQGGDFELRLAAVPGDGPWLKVSTAVANLSDQVGRVRVFYRLTPTAAAGEMTDLISFRKKWIHTTLPLDEKLDLLGSGEEWTWGTVAFSYPEEMIHNQDLYETDPITGAQVLAARSPIDAYVPLAATYNAHDGMVMTVNPRSAFLFRAGNDGLAAGHIYYLPAEKGFVDNGFFDGTGDATNDLYIGYPTKNDWGALWRDYYCRQNEWLRSGPKGEALVTAEALPDDGTFGDLVRRAGVTSIGTGAFNMFSKEEDICKAIANGGGFDRAHKLGYQIPLWTNIFMSPDLDGHGKHWDPELDYRNFKDSWVVGVDGKPLPNWDGFLCTSSPRYSFAQFEFKRLTELVQKYNFDGIFLDLYAFNPDVDWGRTYQHLPFYPLQVAMIEYCKMLSDWCVANNKTLILNCPHPSLMVWNLAGSFQGDTLGIRNDMSLVEKLACAAAGRPHTLLGYIEAGNASGQWLEESIGAIFYGEIPSPWRLIKGLPDSEISIIADLFGRNHRIIDRVGTANFLGGDLERALWFASPAGDAGYVTLRNRTKDVVRPRIRLADRATLKPGQYKVLLWDLTAPATVLAEGDESLADRNFELLIAPGEVKVLCFVNAESAGELIADGLK